jgi:hypothetical protein
LGRGDGSPVAYLGDDTIVPKQYMRVRFLYTGGKVGWSAVHVGGMLMDACRKVQ